MNGISTLVSPWCETSFQKVELLTVRKGMQSSKQDIRFDILSDHGPHKDTPIKHNSILTVNRSSNIEHLEIYNKI